MDVSKSIRAIRESKNLTQVDVAGKLGTERSNYARLENRGENLTIRQISEIATALEVSIYEIIGLPEGLRQKGDHAEKIQFLEEKLKTTEEILKDKRKNIRIYKSFIEWTRDKFRSEFVVSALVAAETLGFIDISIETEEDLILGNYNFTEDQLRQIGDKMFSIDHAGSSTNEFIAGSGFISEKWFIDAFKRINRKRKERVAYAEVKNWVDGVFDFLEDE